MRTLMKGGVAVLSIRDVVLATLIASALVLVPLALGYSSGAYSGYSNGPVGNAANCAACHDFTAGTGGVELIGAPRRYIPGRTYDLTARVFDVEQAGAGFEVSVEATTLAFPAHSGTLHISDPVHTQFSDGGVTSTYVTHTFDGYADSLDNWVANGGSYSYHFQWQAPPADNGLLTFFTSGNAADNITSFFGEHYYFTYRKAPFAKPADADGDEDVDLVDFAMLQRCFGADGTLSPGCEFVDDGHDGLIGLDDHFAMVGLYTGPTAAEPAGYVLADEVRGALLYDKWWQEARLTEPTTDHPLWAVRPDTASNSATGSTTWRCKECHGWDYKGVDGAYGSGPNRTGIAGIFGTTKTSHEIFALLRDPSDHAYTSADTGLTDDDVWDIVKFVRAGQVDTDIYIDDGGTFTGDGLFGSVWYSQACINCHGEDGTKLNFYEPPDVEYVGTIAVFIPEEMLHKTRFGHPGSMMAGTELIHWNVSRAADIGAYAQGFPTE